MAKKTGWAGGSRRYSARRRKVLHWLSRTQRKSPREGPQLVSSTSQSIRYVGTRDNRVAR